MAYSIKQAVKNKNDELFTPKILVEVIYIYINLLKNLVKIYIESQ